MMSKNGLLVAAIALAAFAAAPSDSFAAAKKSKAEQSTSLKDTSQCTGGACTAVNPDRVPSEQHQYRRTRKAKHHQS
jgi:hypothetical protein